MNRIIMEKAVERVTQMISPSDTLCGICHKNDISYPADQVIEVQGIPTAVGMATCRSCFDYIQIVIGEISAEY